MNLSASATTVVPVTLEQMSHSAGHIFVGRCTASATITRNNLTVTEYQFNVTRTLKGESVSVLTVRHLGSLRHGRTLLQGMLPTYQIGQEYLLFLTTESQIGLCAPVGLVQGAFRLWHTPDGRTMALNGNDNLGLVKPSRPLEISLGRALNREESTLANHKSGPVQLDVLLSVTNSLIVRPDFRK